MCGVCVCRCVCGVCVGMCVCVCVCVCVMCALVPSLHPLMKPLSWLWEYSVQVASANNPLGNTIYMYMCIVLGDTYGFPRSSNIEQVHVHVCVLAVTANPSLQ